jgi:hypothetical protein
MPQLGPYSRTATLAKLDQRTKEARLMRCTRAALIAHVGGKPSVVQQTLIERACQLQIRIAMMDRDFADGGVLTEHDSRTYLAWSNSLTRTLRELGLKGAVDKPPSLQDYLAARSATPPRFASPGVTYRDAPDSNHGGANSLVCSQ